ncbi:DUF4092 domain-containing protein, partial [Photobacterium damselae]|uniref:DUF4092 domain-containing protein n=1 Tax=Photobacterium damselae TaxID=38293 RepID=UPI0040675CE5
MNKSILALLISSTLVYSSETLANTTHTNIPTQLNTVYVPGTDLFDLAVKACSVSGAVCTVNELTREVSITIPNTGSLKNITINPTHQTVTFDGELDLSTLAPEATEIVAGSARFSTSQAIGTILLGTKSHVINNKLHATVTVKIDANSFQKLITEQTTSELEFSAIIRYKKDGKITAKRINGGKLPILEYTEQVSTIKPILDLLALELGIQLQQPPVEPEPPVKPPVEPTPDPDVPPSGDVNEAPVISLSSAHIAAVSGGPAETINFQATDSSAGELTASISGFPYAQLTFDKKNKSGTIKVTIPYTRSTTVSNLTLTITDSQGKSAQSTITIASTELPTPGGDNNGQPIPPSQPIDPESTPNDVREENPNIKYLMLASGVPVEGINCTSPRTTSSPTGEIQLLVNNFGNEPIPLKKEYHCYIGRDGQTGIKLAQFKVGDGTDAANIAPGQTIGYVNIEAMDYLAGYATTWHPNAPKNLLALLLAVDVDQNLKNGLNLTEASHTIFEKYRTRENARLDPETFRSEVLAKVYQEPSLFPNANGHGTLIMPAVSEGTTGLGMTKTDASRANNEPLSFIAADAESIKDMGYGTTQEGSTKLVVNGQPVANVRYVGPTYSGYTDINGNYKHRKGESVTFYVGALELGSGRSLFGNLEVHNLGSSYTEGQNIVHFLRQFDTDNGNLNISAEVQEKFNELSTEAISMINFNLPNGNVNPDTQLDFAGTELPIIPNKFEAQFQMGGSAYPILADLGINPIKQSFTYSPYVMKPKLDPVAVQNAMLGFDGNGKPVNEFHIFHSRGRFSLYRPNLATFINIGQNATPVVMARTDKNLQIPFGQLAAFDALDRALPSVEAGTTYTDYQNNYVMAAPQDLADLPNGDDWTQHSLKVSGENASFALPNIAVGQIGKGKVVVMGSSHYFSTLIAPNAYSDPYDTTSNSNPAHCADSQSGDGKGIMGNYVNCNGIPDSDDMFNFMTNTFNWLAKDPDSGAQRPMNIATNINGAMTFNSFANLTSIPYLMLDPKYKNWTMKFRRGPIDPTVDLDPKTTPIFVLQPYMELAGKPYSGWVTKDFVSLHIGLSPDYEQRLIEYVNNGGNVVIMQTLNQPVLEPVIVYNTASPADDKPAFALDVNPLLNAAGLSTSGQSNTVKVPRLPMSFGDGTIKATPKPAHRMQYETTSWVLEKYDDKPFTKNGKDYLWDYGSTETQAQLHALFIEGEKKDTIRANHPDWSEEQISAEMDRQRTSWINDIKQLYQVSECQNNNYHYELNCIEKRPGNGIPQARSTYNSGGDLGRAKDLTAIYQKILIDGKSTTDAMLKSANIGTSLTALYQHELYYRSHGKEGKRLPVVDFNTTFNNVKNWMYTAAPYRYEGENVGVGNKFGHKEVVEFLNCYSGNQYGGQGGLSLTCPDDIFNTMIKYGFLTQNGSEFNPSWPLNYQEKPLTRLMLGRATADASLGDSSVKMDVSLYPGETFKAATTFSGQFNNGGTQSTGMWAKPHELITVTGLAEEDQVLIGLHDSLSSKHEKSLHRPPQMQQVIRGGKAAQGFYVPFGGLIYIKTTSGETINVTISGPGAVEAPRYVLTENGTGSWANNARPSEIDPAPVAEVETPKGIYTLPSIMLSNKSDDQILEFAQNWQQFANEMDKFYGRYTTTTHQNINHAPITASDNGKLRFVMDKQISAGAAHSGYPVMQQSYPTIANLLPNAMTNWLIGHEFGHNEDKGTLFDVVGASETSNNLLAMYTNSIEHNGELTGRGFEGSNHLTWGSSRDNLSIFGSLIKWAESNFDITKATSMGVPAELLDNTHSAGANAWNFVKSVHYLG